jgi:hypothetical protein
MHLSLRFRVQARTFQRLQELFGNESESDESIRQAKLLHMRLNAWFLSIDIPFKMTSQ